MDAEEMMRRAAATVEEFVTDLVGEGLFAEWAQAANKLYRQQYDRASNPYDELWEGVPRYDKRWVKTKGKDNYKFGKVSDISDDGFELVVAAPNPRRSCVPFEPRGLGRWKPAFDRILRQRGRILFSKVRP